MAPLSAHALHSPLAAVRTTASDQLHRALADVHYPEAWKVDACGRLIGIVGEEDAGEAGAGIAAGRLLGAATPGALLCRAAGLREELHRVALLPTAAPRLRALAVALEVVYGDADLAAPLLPAVRGALEAVGRRARQRDLHGAAAADREGAASLQGGRRAAGQPARGAAGVLGQRGGARPRCYARGECAGMGGREEGEDRYHVSQGGPPSAFDVALGRAYCASRW